MDSTVAKSGHLSATVAPTWSHTIEKKVANMTAEEPKEINTQSVDEESLELVEKNPRVKWCFDNKEAILALHSSTEHTKVFEMYCDGCERYFKHCMFSKKERKGLSHSILCRWCQAEMSIGTDPQQFCIDSHVHCNRGGKKECGTFPYHTLDIPPNRILAKEAGINDIVPTTEQFTIKKKMSQKERKALERKQREEMGF